MWPKPWWSAWACHLQHVLKSCCWDHNLEICSMKTKDFVTYEPRMLSAEDTAAQARAFRQLMAGRRSFVFSDRPVPKKPLLKIWSWQQHPRPHREHNKQPWFLQLWRPKLKTRIRKPQKKKEEYENYHGRMGGEWLDDLKNLIPTTSSPFETAPWLIVYLKAVWNGSRWKRKNYYVQESVGIAAGLLIAAIHQAGLVTLTHTPSPMQFLGEILGRPEEERHFCYCL